MALDAYDLLIGGKSVDVDAVSFCDIMVLICGLTCHILLFKQLYLTQEQKQNTLCKYWLKLVTVIIHSVQQEATESEKSN